MYCRPSRPRPKTDGLDAWVHCFHGATIMTHDADLAVTGDSYTRFINLAKDDSRFAETVLGAWEYTSSYDFLVEVDFLDKNGDRGYIHKLREYSLIDGIPVATPVDLAIGKGTTWVERKIPKDFTGLEYSVTIRAWQGLDFKSLDEQATKRLDDIMWNTIIEREENQFAAVKQLLALCEMCERDMNYAWASSSTCISQHE
ncbi:hypothetical protein L873DRAFT_1845839 [Choiromyces venosus 120613-1]|uniref:Uncharacterized protein n=1 Tax=Choiromyces venosus 120613-1 TaxID=1336337 RepID=A0A3N4JBV5_9PEZI|nr:hypothetical protein L873DRAFT_1845839 [Choiromyces venosus 120613-1]